MLSYLPSTKEQKNYKTNLMEHLEAKELMGSITEPKGESGLTFIGSTDT